MTYSVHSLRAVRSFASVALVISKMGLALFSWISARAATAFATTIGLLSDIKSFSPSRNPLSSTSSAFISKSLATQIAAVLRTYGSSSCEEEKGRELILLYSKTFKHICLIINISTLRHLWRGSHKYSVILSTRMQPIVLTARARIKGFGSCESCKGIKCKMSARAAEIDGQRKTAEQT